MLPAMKPGICVFAWAPPVCECERAAYPRINRIARPSRAESSQRRRASQRVRCASLFKGGGQVYIARHLLAMGTAIRGKTMLPSAKRLNLLGPQWWKLAAVCGVAVLLSATWASVGRAQDRAVTYAPADIGYGAQIYAAQCSACHGVNGQQVGGVDLGGGGLRRASSDEDVRTVLDNGIRGMAMPRFCFG